MRKIAYQLLTCEGVEAWAVKKKAQADALMQEPK